MFERLKKAEIAGKTARLPLPQVNPDFVLIGKPALPGANPEYWAELIRQGQVKGKADLTPAEIDTLTTESDRILYPQFVITGWENCLNDEDEEVMYTVENGLKFFKVLPSYLMHQIKNYFGAAKTFLEQDPDELAKN